MRKTLLLADASISIQKVVELTFQDEPIDIVTAADGQTAIDQIQKQPPDIVLVSAVLPKKDGYQVCEIIKKDDRLARIPMVLLVGAFEPFEQERAARVGVTAVVNKPFEPQALLEKVQSLWR